MHNFKQCCNFSKCTNTPSFAIFRKGDSDLVIKNNVSATFFNREWHKLEIQFGRNEIRFYIDCYLVGTYPVDVPMHQILSKTGNMITGSYDRSGKSPIVSVPSETEFMILDFDHFVFFISIENR